VLLTCYGITERKVNLRTDSHCDLRRILAEDQNWQWAPAHNAVRKWRSNDKNNLSNKYKLKLFPSIAIYPSLKAPCALRGCKNRAHSVSWLEVIKGVPNQGVDCFVT